MGASKARVAKAEEGLQKLLGRDASSAEQELEHATSKLKQLKAKERKKLGLEEESEEGPAPEEVVEEEGREEDEAEKTPAAKAKSTRKKK